MRDPARVIARAAQYGATVMPGVPTMHTLILMNENLASWGTGHVRLVITGGPNSEPDLLEKLYKTFPGATVVNFTAFPSPRGPWC